MSDGLPRIERRILPQRTWFFLGLAAGILVLLWFAGDAVREALAYDRERVLHGEYWRLATGHLVHGTFLHALLNIAGLVLVALLFPYDYSPRQWFVVALLSAVAIDVAFVLWEPQVTWYVGLSGVLHGALAAGAIALWRHESRYLALAVSVIFVAKLVWEQMVGALPLSGDMPVVVDSHLYGAIGGTVAGFVLWLAGRRFPRERPSL